MWLLWAAVALSSSSSSSSSSAEDRRCLERMARGEADAMAELYDRHGRAVYSLALRILRDQRDAEDLVQDVFSQAWNQASRYDAGRGPVVGWLLNMTRTRAIDRVRSRNARPVATADETALLNLADRAPLTETEIEWKERAAVVRSAFEQLPLTQRLAVELAFYEGLTHSEIAAHLELPLGTVKARIRQGLLKMKDTLKGVME